MNTPQKLDLTYEHRVLDSARAARRYFAKFERIIDHLSAVAKLSVKERQLSKT